MTCGARTLSTAVLFVALSISYFAAPGDASIIKGVIEGTADQETFITKFAYGPEGGDAEFLLVRDGDVQDTVAEDRAGFFIFLREDAYWTYKGLPTCKEKIDFLKAEYGEVLDYYAFIAPRPDASTTPYKISESGVRAYFYYVAFSMCNWQTENATSLVDQNGKAYGIAYDILLTNGNSGDFWTYQYSFEYIGVPGAYTAYFIFWIILLTAHVVVNYRAQNFEHILVKIFTAAMALQFCAVFFNFIHWINLGHNGVGVQGLANFGEFCQMSSQCVFMLLLLMLAKGFTITTSSMSKKRVLFGIWGVYSALYLVMFIWQVAGQDPESSLDKYQTPPGGIILTMRMLILLWFIYELRMTYMQENTPEKLKFYKIFGFSYVLWFVALPLVVIFTAVVVPPWRFKVITGCFLTMNYLAMTGMVALVWPSRSASYFALSADGPMIGSTGASSGALPYDAI